MPGPTTVTAAQLVRLIGTPECPTLIDVRDDTADARQIPGASRCTADAPDTWAATLPPRAAIVVCEDGMLSAGVAAWLRHAGIDAETLEGGMAAWRAAGAPLLNPAPLPVRDDSGRTVWVTRARPKVSCLPSTTARFSKPAPSAIVNCALKACAASASVLPAR